ncbi:MAG: hypothetical protein E7434_05580 [Ruminococcaceae bacterium]|nr:hypothetical protein [Oscillospiraceae bacterium]
MSLYEKKRNSQVPEEEIAENRLSAKTRACTLLMLSVIVFLCAVVTCAALIAKSVGDNDGEKTLETHVEDIKYVANNTNNTETPSNDTPDVKLTAPVSVYDSNILNILLVGTDSETAQTDALIVVSVDMEKGQPSMLSIPRDTYISGDYSTPKINRVYAENGSRGIEALKESVENMLGFRLDNYLVFDREALAEVLQRTGGIDFEIPEEPTYHDLLPGEQNLSGEKAFALFRYREDYTDVETEPYRVQRDFLAKILDTLLADQENNLENAELICQATDTDLEATELAYLTDLLKNARFAASFSRALPGGEITIRDEAYYQVDPAQACEILNGHFNPTGSDLTEYDVHFRQLQGDSGEGEMADFGFGGPHPTQNNSGTNDETEATEETEETEPTEESESLDEQEPSEQAPESSEDETEAPSESDALTEELPEETNETEDPEPIETAEPTVSEETAEPVDPAAPIEPDGDE